jgi:hypothetical protein
MGHPQASFEQTLTHLRNRLGLIEKQLAELERLTQDRESLKGAAYSLDQFLQLGSEQSNSPQQRASAQETLSHLRTRLADVEEQLAGLQELLQDREVVKRAIHDLEQVARLASGEAIEREDPLWKGAQQVLTQNGGPMSARAITEALLARGWRIEGKAPVENVRSALLRKPEIFDRGRDHSFVVRPNVENRRERLG